MIVGKSFEYSDTLNNSGAITFNADGTVTGFNGSWYLSSTTGQLKIHNTGTSTDYTLTLTGSTSTTYTAIESVSNGSTGTMTFTLWQPAVAPTTPSSDPLIYTNGNIYGVQSGPTNPTTFSISTSYKVTYMNTYHYFNGGKLPGTISLKHSDGTVYGPWQATGLAGQGGVANATWIVQPNVVIKPGNYTVLDSDNATWSQNSQSSNAGFVEIRGIASGTTGTPTLVSISVTPANPTITVGMAQQFTATGSYSDNSTQNLTSSVTWSSSPSSIATIATTGMATAVAAGSTTITATSGAVTGSTPLTVVGNGGNIIATW
jgi:hypothetical protein